MGCGDNKPVEVKREPIEPLKFREFPRWFRYLFAIPRLAQIIIYLLICIVMKTAGDEELGDKFFNRLMEKDWLY